MNMTLSEIDFEEALQAIPKNLEEAIRSRNARVGIVGLGYVGLPLAVEFAKAGFQVTGIDVNSQKVARVNAGDSYVGDIPSGVLASLVGSILLSESETSQTLVWKAAAELTDLGMSAEQAKAFAERLGKLLRQLL